MQAIILDGSSNDTPKLQGKTIKGVSFYEDHHLALTFTDDTYVLVKTDGEYLRSHKAVPLESVVNPWMEIYPEGIQRLLDLGILVKDPVKFKALQESWEKAEYQKYLQLKKKYEGWTKK